MCDLTTFKAGDTFVATVTYAPLPGEPANLLSSTVTSGFLDVNDIYYTGAVVVAVDGLSFTVTLSETSTALWPWGNTVAWDVKYVFLGVTSRSDTEMFMIQRPVTA